VKSSYRISNGSIHLLTTPDEADALYAVATDTYEAKLVTDISLGYHFTKNWKLNVGVSNLFNVYPTPQFDGWTDQGGFNDSVQMGSDGKYYFARVDSVF
jgi:iron complex outermembrane receptor protein